MSRSACSTRGRWRIRYATIETRWLQAARRIWQFEEPPAPHLWPLLLVNRNSEIVAPKGAAKAPVVEARLNHAVWQTVCPFCGSAQHASPADRRFYCANCMNDTVGHRTLPVKWPRNAGLIEEHLARRPLPRHRNWEPGETIRDLARQDADWKKGGK